MGRLTEADFTADELRLMKSYAGQACLNPRSVEEVPFQESTDTWPLPEFLKLLNEAVESIPETFRDRAEVELQGGYDESTWLKITYSRPETNNEFNVRVGKYAEYARRQIAEKERRDASEYQRLKAKFEGERP